MRFPRDPAVMRKFLVALLGVGVITAAQFGLVVPDLVSEQVGGLIDASVGLLTAGGVFIVPNEVLARPDVVPAHEGPVEP